MQAPADRPVIRAAPGIVALTPAIAPTPGMLERLERDYVNMAGMIFGPIPPFREVVRTIVDLERRLNEPGS